MIDTTTVSASSLLDDVLAASTPERIAALAQQRAEADIPATVRKEAEDEARKAWHAAMADQPDAVTAKRLATAAYKVVLERHAAPEAKAPAIRFTQAAPAAPVLPAFEAELPAPPVSPRPVVLTEHPATCGCSDCETADEVAEVTPRPMRAAALELARRADEAPAVAEGALDVIGAERSQGDFDAARAAGFAPKPSLYTRGTRVVQMGVDNARSSREAFDAMPTMLDAAGAFVARIEAEHRRHQDAPAAALTFFQNGTMTWPGAEAPLPLTETAFKALCARRGHGGADYLRRCPTGLRAMNLNTWSGMYGDRDAAAREAARQAAKASGKPAPSWTPPTLRLRLRDQVHGDAKGEQRARPEVFAVTSTGYTAFDVDQIAKALRVALDTRGREALNLEVDGQRVDLAAAKGAITYDGERARFEVLFHTDVRPEHFVAGEFFKAGVVVTTDDTAGGSIVVRSVVWQNLCLNLLIIDECSIPVARLVHVGDVQKLARKFRAGVAKALGNLKTFVARWGAACVEDVIEGARRVTPAEVVIPEAPAERAAGIFRGIIEAKKFTAYPGRDVEGIVSQLVARWQEDESGAKLHHGGLTRAAIANAITAFAHNDLPRLCQDPWLADQAQLEAGALLWGAKRGQAPAPLAFAEEHREDAAARA